LLWYLNGDPTLSKNIIKELNDENNQIIVSMASLWEFSIKLTKEKKININISLQQVEDI